ncbi:MAG: TfuA-like protein, partial [Methanobacteriaceae archaeon]
YSSGEIDSDDDVAVAFVENYDGINNETKLEQISEPLVNVKYSTSIAVDKKIINKEEKEKIIATAKNIHYNKRNYPTIIKESPILEKSKIAFEEFVSSPENQEILDIKKQDAISLINYIKSLYGA